MPRAHVYFAAVLLMLVATSCVVYAPATRSELRVERADKPQKYFRYRQAQYIYLLTRDSTAHEGYIQGFTDSTITVAQKKLPIADIMQVKRTADVNSLVRGLGWVVIPVSALFAGVSIALHGELLSDAILPGSLGGLGLGVFMVTRKKKEYSTHTGWRFRIEQQAVRPKD